MANYIIDSLNLSNDKHVFTLPYGISSTAASTAAKTVTVENFVASLDELEVGTTINVKFTNANSASSPTLNVNDIGAIAISSPYTVKGGAYKWVAGSTLLLTYDGTNWVRQFVEDTNTTYSVATQSANGLMAAADKKKLDELVIPTSFNITATATDDNVVDLTATGGANSVTITGSHAKKGPSSGYTSGNTTTSISGSGASKTIKIPQITVDTYGHVTAAADESVAITLPTIPTTLKNPHALTIGEQSYDGSAAVTITAKDLGLTGALTFIGSVDSLPETTTYQVGNVILVGTKEYVLGEDGWILLGDEGSYKVKQTAKSSPSASGNATAFIDTISQDANGVITATKKNVPTMGGASSSAAGTAGLVPAPAKGEQGEFLRGDGTWAVPTNTTYGAEKGISLTNGKFGHSNTAITAGSVGSAQTPSHGGTFAIPKITYDAYGHITNATTVNVTLPADNNTTYGLSGALSGNTFVNTLTPSSGNATTSTVPAMTAATADVAGKAGLVPAPGAGKNNSFLRGDGTWVVPTNTTYTPPKLGFGYATCATEEATKAKVATLSSYTLTTHGIVAVKFTYAVPAGSSSAAITLNINSKGAKHVYYNGTHIAAGVIKAGDVATFIYTGSVYELISVNRWHSDITTLNTRSINHTHTVSHTPAGSNASVDITPAGTVSKPTFTGTAASHKHTFTGTEASHKHTITVSEAELSTSYTPAGTVTVTLNTGSKTSGAASTSSGHTVSVAAAAHTHSYTPAGTNSKPTFTGSEGTTTSIDGTTSLYQITGVGSVPSLKYTAGTAYGTKSVDKKCLIIGNVDVDNITAWSAGSVPTRASVTVASSTHSHKYTPSGEVSAPTFTGTAATIAASTTTAATVPTTSHTHSTSGFATSVKSATFAGTAATIDHTHTHTATASDTAITPAGTISETSITPAGSVSQPTFTGTKSTHTHTFTGTAATLTTSKPAN